VTGGNALKSVADIVELILNNKVDAYNLVDKCLIGLTSPLGVLVVAIIMHHFIRKRDQKHSG